MQYTWANTIVAVLLIGSFFAAIAILIRGLRSPLGRNLQIGTTVAIFAVFLHNLYWESEINEMASKGWTLLYTFPAFVTCLLVSGLLAVIYAVSLRRRHRRSSDPTIRTEHHEAEPDAAGQPATPPESKGFP